jgi:glycerophosphoryl diester phosphodiesterase
MAARAGALAIPASLLLDASVPKTLRATAIVADIHAAGLAVHAFAGGAGETFPPPPLKPGDARRAMAALFAGGVDGVLADLASPAARARSDALAPRGG